METQRPRRRRSRRKARRKQVILLVVVAAAVGIAIWTSILIDRHNDVVFTAGVAEPAADRGAVAFSASSASLASSAASAPSALAPKNLILFIGTGYGYVPTTATRIYATGEGGSLALDRLPATAMVRTTSRNAQSADSAAAMTAYMTGVRVDNEVLSQTAETRPYDEAGRPQAAHGETACPTAGNGKPQTTLLEMAKAAGRATGVVTTARVTQPIAAATYAHLCQRDGENTIATQLVPGGSGANDRLGDGVDVVLGGGWERFLPRDDPRGSVRNDARDLFAELRAKGYAVVGRQGELAAIAPATRKLIGLFSRTGMAYDADRAGTSEPSLAEMTGRAIDLLTHGRSTGGDGNGSGYLLVVEGGRIGDALDAQLARKALQEGRAFDDAIAVALDRVREIDPDLRNTTIVVTADHDHTLIMTGNSTTNGRTTEVAAGIVGVLRSDDQPTQPALDASGRPYAALVFGGGTRRIRGPRSAAPPLSDLAMADKNLQDEAAVELASSSGGSDVPLAATGVNAARFRGSLDNIQVFTLLREAMGL